MDGQPRGSAKSRIAGVLSINREPLQRALSKNLVKKKSCLPCIPAVWSAVRVGLARAAAEIYGAFTK